MIIEKTLYALDDITIVPCVESEIRHRSEINSFYDIDQKQYLPIFVSPMECVINIHNFDIYEKNNVIPILPRTETFADRYLFALRGKWAAFGLDEFEKAFCTNKIDICNDNRPIRVLIDVANGHMKQMQDSIRKAKEIAKISGYTIEIMAGNVANPETYMKLSEAGADYVRCAVGTGNCCITTSNTSIHYAMASLIDDCKKLKDGFNLTAKIIADGGISNYSRAIKALALGADYVMIGSTFGRCFESSSEFINFDKPQKAYTYYSLSDVNKMRFENEITEEEKKDIIKMYAPMIKTVWGMSTRRAQTSIAKALGKCDNEIKTKTSEGVEKEVTVDYTLHQWIENFTDYLRSSMSYCNARTLNDFIGKPKIMLLSEGAKSSVNK